MAYPVTRRDEERANNISKKKRIGDSSSIDPSKAEMMLEKEVSHISFCIHIQYSNFVISLSWIHYTALGWSRDVNERNYVC